MSPADPVLLAPVRWAAAGPLLLSSLAVMGSPGPATISLTAAGSAYGLRRSARYLVGVTAGTTIVLLAVASGVTVTLLAVPGLRAVLIVASAAYILWLAYRIATAPPLPAQQAAAQAPSLLGKHRGNRRNGQGAQSHDRADHDIVAHRWRAPGHGHAAPGPVPQYS